MRAANLRKSILQAAVQGKLVPQDNNDEPASELLKRIQAERAKLVKMGKLKKEKPLPSITEDEIPYDLPEGWVWCRLREIGEIVGGATPDSGNEEYYTLPNQGIPWITPADMRSARDNYISRGVKDITKAGYASCSTKMLPAESIIFSSRAPIGYMAFAKNPLCTNQGFKSVIPFHPKTTHWIYFAIKSKIEDIIGRASGTTFKEVSGSFMEQELIPLPSLAEQQRIVAKVGELMALCDELEATEKEQDALEHRLADGLPKSILQVAVQGKLVPQDKDDEPASELLKRIHAEKVALIKAGKLKREKALPPVSEEEMPYDLPLGWVWCRLGDIAIINPRNTLPDNAKVSFIPMPLISSEYFGGHQQEIKLWGEIKSGFTHFAEGDVLLAKITPCFQNGKSCIACNLHSGYGAGTTELHVLRCILIEAQYLLLFLKSPFFITEAKRNMTGTAGQQRVPTEYLRQFPLPLPPLAEQQRIVAKVDELMTLCEELKHVDAQPIDRSHIIPFPAAKEAAPGPIAIAARGDADEFSIQAQQAIDALLAEDK